MLSSAIQFLEFEGQTYAQTRALQEQLVQKRLQGVVPDSILLGDHPPTLALGRRSHEKDLGISIEAWKKLGVCVEQVDRGGSATFHAPGQLIVYPVIHLTQRKLGVREFVSRMLLAIAQTVCEIGIPAESDLCDAGVWVRSNAGRKKVASVGLRIVHGVTNHGFALNVDCDLEPFRMFRPCGFSGEVMTSLAAEQSDPPIERAWVIERLKTVILEKLSETTHRAAAC